jgi:PAS domain S-box-containing protein
VGKATQDVTARHRRPGLGVRPFTVLSALPDARGSTVAGVTAGFVVAVGVLVLAGWTFNVPVLKGPGGLIEMKANDAVGCVALGVSLLLTGDATSGWRGRTARVLAAFTVVLGAMTIVEYLFGRNLGLDQLLFRDAHGVATVDPGRLAPQTAVIFVLLGVALLLLNTVKTAASRVVRVFTGRTGAARELRLAALVDASSDAILSSDADGIITSWNHAAERLYGYTEQEMIGRSVTQLTPATELADHRQMLKAVAQGESRNDVEIQSVHKNGSLLDVSVTISKIMRDNSLIGFCGVAHSNTERLRARDELEERVLERTRDLVTSRAETLQMLAQAAEHRDDDTARHTERVGKSAARLACALGLGSDLVELIGQAAPLHDVGKIGIPDRILLKPGRLTTEEFEMMKQHTTLGASLLARSGAAVLKLGEQIAMTHHERWDGAGYPNQLAGDAIPIAGRIVAVVDSFDAMTNDRTYREASSAEEALTEISRCSGKQFDPQVATAFLRLHHHADPSTNASHVHQSLLLAASAAAPQRSP